MLFFLAAGGYAQEGLFSWKGLPAGDIKVYDPVAFSFDIHFEVTNPYNSDEVRIDMEIWAPGNRRYLVPAFFYQSFNTDGQSRVPGESFWKVRFTPELSGEYQYYLIIRNKGRTTRSDILRFSVTSDNGSRGFVRSDNGDYFLYDNGDPFFAVGFNLSHPGKTPLDYKYFFAKWANAGMNYTRLWLAPPWGPHAFALEWTDSQFPDQKGKLGLHRINQQVAWQLDDFIRSAEEYGIYVMLCLGDERELETGISRGEVLTGNRSFWNENPYNATNGGPAVSPLEFFTSEQARKIYKDRLRYIIARWGYSTHVLAWEFWNEIDHTKWAQDWNFVMKNVAGWHEEMGIYMKSTDPFRHYVTTSFLGDQPSFWHLDVLNLVQGHGYGGGRNMAGVALNMTERFKQRYPFKPFFISELGTDFTGYTRAGNAEEVAIHNAIWATALSGGSGTAMWWWWNTIDEMDLYRHYAVLNTFISDIPWHHTGTLQVGTDHKEALAIGRITGNKKAWLWVHNRNHNWSNAKAGEKAGTVDFTLTITGLVPGTYIVSEFDTYTGKFVHENKLTSSGELKLGISRLEKDKAYRLEIIE